jgi:hypothetical protein
MPSADMREGAIALLTVLVFIIILSHAINSGWLSKHKDHMVGPKPTVKARIQRAMYETGHLQKRGKILYSGGSFEFEADDINSAADNIWLQQRGVEEVDPEITGALYSGRGYTRDVFQSSSLDSNNLFASSSGVKGEIGIDQGPLGLDRPEVGHYVGMPREYLTDRTPTRTTSSREDYYGPEGPTLVDGGRKLKMTSLPDHDPLS